MTGEREVVSLTVLTAAILALPLAVIVYFTPPTRPII